MINIYQPQVGKEELQAIKKVFDSNWLGKGKVTEQFINRISQKLRKDTYEYGYTPIDKESLIPISSCTEGLFQICKSMKFQPGDQVIIPSIHFIGAINAIKANNGTPVFCDVDKRTLNVRVEDLEKVVTDKTVAVMILHYGGRPCDMNEIMEFCNNKSIKVIEDNANSPFSTYNGRSTGTIGDFGTWSFDSMKIMVMGDAGLIYCKDKSDKELIENRIYLGLNTQSGFSNTQDNKWWEFDIEQPGNRSIINDITAAIGVEQLKKVDRFIGKRKEIHDYYSEELKDLNWLDIPPVIESDRTSSYYMYHIQTRDSKDRDVLAAHLKDLGIYTTFRYYPLHKVPFYSKQYSTILPNTDYVTDRTLCIPIHQSLTMKEALYITKKIKGFKK